MNKERRDEGPERRDEGPERRDEGPERRDEGPERRNEGTNDRNEGTWNEKPYGLVQIAYRERGTRTLPCVDMGGTSDPISRCVIIGN